MSTDVTPQPTEQDERFARFTDQLLDGQAGGEGMGRSEDPDMHKLERTAELVWRVLGREEPDRALRSRIYQSLVAEWRDRQVGRRGPFWTSWQRRLRVASKSEWGAMLLAVAAILVLAIGVGMAAAPAGSEISGAAGGAGSIALIAVGTGGLLIVLVWLFTGSHR